MNSGRTIFAQVLELLPRRAFESAIERYGGHRKLRLFSCMDQLLCMIFAQLTARSSLRETVSCLRALGTRPSRVLWMFLAEGVAIAVAGCAAGAIFALVVRVGLNASGIILPPPPGATHGMPINVRFYPLAYAAGLVAMILTMSLASFFPARRASRVSIVEALTHV